jgi:ferric-dicitrate binding protein FerR (iron transport regulator)
VRAFTGTRRELTLDGAAVFDVVHDSRRPFVVDAANAVTEDLGTRFAISAYPGAEAVRVVVVSGKVSVRPKQSTAGVSRDAVVLAAGELAHIGATGRVDVVSNVVTDAYTAWLSDRISFQNARVDDVAADLERRYDVAIHIAEPSVAARRVTLDMPARTLDEVLDAITVPLGLHHRRVDNAVVLER